MKLRLIDDSGKVNTLEIPGSVILGSSVVVAIVSALATLATNYLVDIPTLRVTQLNQMSVNELARKKFQLDLMQRAFQAKTPEHRAASLNILVEAKLLDIPNKLLAKLTTSPGSLPEWAPESTSAAVPGTIAK